MLAAFFISSDVRPDLMLPAESAKIPFTDPLSMSGQACCY
jgi:hypothetical protein